MKHRTRITVVVALTTALASIATVAMAVSTAIDDVDLTGADATWDAANSYDYGDDGAPCTSSSGGFSPADDVALGSQDDAFDGGLFLNVDGKVFNDGDENGDLRNSIQQLTVGPTKMSRLQVTRIERALQETPTLRTLVRLENPTSNDISVPIAWDSAMAPTTPSRRAHRARRRTDGPPPMTTGSSRAIARLRRATRS
jgi:hypothetical protein